MRWEHGKESATGVSLAASGEILLAFFLVWNIASVLQIVVVCLGSPLWTTGIVLLATFWASNRRVGESLLYTSCSLWSKSETGMDRERELLTIYKPEDVEKVSRRLYSARQDDGLYSLQFISRRDGCNISMLSQFLCRHSFAARRIDRLSISGMKRLPLPELCMEHLKSIFVWTPQLTELILYGVEWVASDVSDVKAPATLRNLFVDGVLCRSNTSVLEVLTLHGWWNRVRVHEVEHYQIPRFDGVQSARFRWLALKHLMAAEFTDVADKVIPLVGGARQLTLHGQERVLGRIFRPLMERVGNNVRELHMCFDREDLWPQITTEDFASLKNCAKLKKVVLSLRLPQDEAKAESGGKCLLHVLRNLPDGCVGLGVDLLVTRHTEESITSVLQAMQWDEIGCAVKSLAGLRETIWVLRRGMNDPLERVVWNRARVRGLCLALRPEFSSQHYMESRTWAMICRPGLGKRGRIRAFPFSMEGTPRSSH